MGVAERLRGEARRLQQEWASQERWRGIVRPYAAEDVVRLRGSVTV
jgi:isocitrate lyase